VDAVIRLELDPTTLYRVNDPKNRDIFLHPGDLLITPDMNAEGYFVG
jgi:hypothetical protein